MFYPDIGGIETLAMKLLPDLVARGHQVLALASHSRLDLPEESIYSDIPVYRYPMLEAIANRDLLLIKEIHKKVTKLKCNFQPDIVHICFGPPVIALYHLKTIEAYPSSTLLTINANLTGYNAGKNTLLRKLFQSTDWITSDSQASLSIIQQIYPEINQKSSVIYNGVLFPENEVEAISFDSPHIVCIGRLADEKGFDIVINSFEQILQHHPKAHLTIAGDGPARHDLEDLVREKGIADFVDFPGRIDHQEIMILLNSAAIVVIPSRILESFPMVALEAASMARPIIATRIGGLPESVIQGETGMLFEKEDQDGLTEAIQFLLENPDIAVEMGKQSRLRAKNMFDWACYVDQYENLYKTVSVQ